MFAHETWSVPDISSQYILLSVLYLGCGRSPCASNEHEEFLERSNDIEGNSPCIELNMKMYKAEMIISPTDDKENATFDSK